MMNALQTRLRRLEDNHSGKYVEGMAFVSRADDGTYTANCGVNDLKYKKSLDIRITAASEDDVLRKADEWFKTHLDPNHGNCVIFTGEDELED
jgi:hypothetical protein